MRGFGTIDYLIFAAYLAASVLIGVLFVREQKSVKDYFLAGQSMSYIPIAISVIAALFSGISYLGAPAEAYAHDISFSLVLMAFFVATPTTTLLFLPFFYRLKLYTAYEYLERRFSVQIRVLSSGLFILRAVLWLALATYAPALALSEVTGFPMWSAIILTGALTTLYTTLGGMKAVIWTDVMQFFVLFGGMLAILGTAIYKIPGGLSQALHIAQEGGRLRLFDFSFSLTTRTTFWALIVGGAFMNMVQMATDQVSVQRYLTAASLRESKKSLWLKLALTVPVGGLFYFCGVILYSFYQVHGDPIQSHIIDKADRILPYFVITELPTAMPGILIAAVYAATMSTISAGINSLSTATIMDFYGRLWDPHMNEGKQLALARWLTLIYGALTLVLAFVVEKLGTLLEASNTIIGLVGGPLLGIFLLGILSRRANAKGVFVGWCVGVALGLIMTFGTRMALWTSEPLSDLLATAGRTSFLWYTMLSCLGTVVVGLTASRFFEAPSRERLVNLVARPGYWPKAEVNEE